MKQIRRKAVEKWLKDNQDYINGTGLDKRINAALGTVQKYLKYDRKLNDKRINAIYKLLSNNSIENYIGKIIKNSKE